MEIDEIEQPIPPVAGNQKYPLASLQVGQSFILKDAAGTNKVCSAIYRYKQRHAGADFTARAVPGGVRVWRTK